MYRRVWKRDTLNIVYDKSGITPHREDLLTSIDDAMYFYYDIEILDGKKKLFSSRAYDFPKVQNLPSYIDHMLDMDETDMFVYEDYENNGFHRKTLYNFVVLNDSFDLNAEYFYKIERTITYVKQRAEVEFKIFEHFTLTIGQNARNKEGYSNGEDFGQSVYIDDLKRDDLLELKKTAEDFCKCAVDCYNDDLKKYKIKCPKCEEHQLYLDSLLPINKEVCGEEFKCVGCGHQFVDDYYIG